MLKWLIGTPAQRAGRKDGRLWQTVLYHTKNEIEDLTGYGLYEHACEEARKWLRSHFKNGKEYADMSGGWSYEEKKHPENIYHSEFLEYVESFVSEFSPEMMSYPKE